MNQGVHKPYIYNMGMIRYVWHMCGIYMACLYVIYMFNLIAPLVEHKPELGEDTLHLGNHLSERRVERCLTIVPFAASGRANDRDAVIAVGSG